MALGDCINQSAANVYDLLSRAGHLYDTTLFVDPNAQMAADILSGGAGTKNAIFALLLNPGSGLDLATANDCVTLYNLAAQLTGGQTIVSIGGVIPPYSPVLGAAFGYPVMNQFTALSGFLSGTVPLFPASSINPGLGVSNIALLGTMTFAGLLGVGLGSKATEQNLCKQDPNDPCRKMAAIFGPVLGLLNNLLLAIITGLAAMEDFLNSVAAYIAQIQGWIASLIQAITGVLNSILKALFDSLRLGLSLLFSALDPCLRQVMGNIAGPDLAHAIGL